MRWEVLSVVHRGPHMQCDVAMSGQPVNAPHVTRQALLGEVGARWIGAMATAVVAAVAPIGVESGGEDQEPGEWISVTGLTCSDRVTVRLVDRTRGSRGGGRRSRRAIEEVVCAGIPHVEFGIFLRTHDA